MPPAVHARYHVYSVVTNDEIHGVWEVRHGHPTYVAIDQPVPFRGLVGRPQRVVHAGQEAGAQARYPSIRTTTASLMRESER